MAASRVLVLDVDQVHNEKIGFALRETTDLHVEFYQHSEQVIDVLNNKSVEMDKLKEIEVAIASGITMQNKVLDTIVKSEKQLIEKSGQFKLLSQEQAQKADAAAVEKSMRTLETQIAKCKELKSKLEVFMVQKQEALASAKAKLPQAGDKKIHLVLIDRSFLGNIPSNWIETFRTQISIAENKEVPVAVLGYNENFDYIQQTLEGGVIDYFVKPVDLLLFKHNTAKISGKVLDSSQKVFEIKTQADIKMLRRVIVLSISEFELLAQTNFTFTTNEICEFYADQFSADKGGRLLGRCLECNPDTSKKGSFLSKFSLVGLSPTRLIEMRKWMRAQYIAIKAKEKE